MAKLFVVGDSTVATFNDVTYYYSRYGYGAVLNEYFNIEVINLALSGRSSKSYTFDPQYKTLFDNLKEGDYVFIGFGHNDEKSDDSFRFTDASLPLDNPNSFKYSLFNNYIKKILELKATPILTTPVVRLSPTDEYKNELIHITKNGDYRKAIIELCNELNLFYVDITNESLKEVSSLGFKKSLPLHAMTKGKLVNNVLTYDEKSVDETHLSYYGAKMNAYYIAYAIQNSKLELKKYLINDIKKPTIDELKANPLYEYKPYVTPDLDNYKPKDNYKADEYYGTAFGSIDSSNQELDGFMAKGDKNKYIVGQSGDKTHGRINASTEGFAFLFKRIQRSDNFIISAKAKVIKCANIRQAGFGLMLRGDSYLNQTSNQNIVTNYISSGLITTDKVTYAIFARPSTTDIERVCSVGEYFYKEGDIADLKIERLGQVVKVYVKYNDNEYRKEFIDYDYYNDEKYLFVGMFSTNGTLVEFTDVKFDITGKAIEA